MNPLLIATALSGLSSGIGDYLASENASDATNSAISYLTGLQGNVQDQTDSLVSSLTSAYSPYTSSASSDYSALRNAVEGADYQTYATNEAFDDTLDTDAFINSQADYLISKGVDSLMSSAANAGNLFSGETGTAAVDYAESEAQKYYDEALAAAMEDRSFKYSEYQDTISNNNAAVDQANELLNSNISNLGTLANMGLTATTNLADQTTSLQSSANSDINSIASVIGQLTASNSGSSLLGSLLSGLGSLATSLLGK